MATDSTNLSATARDPNQYQNVLNSEFTSVQANTTSDPYGLNSAALSTFASSSQTLNGSGSNLEVLTPDANIVQNRIVFSTVNEEVRAAKTLTLRNTGSDPLTIEGLNFGDSQEKDNAVRIADYSRGATDFRFVNGVTLPITLAANESIDLSIKFAPKRVSSISDTTTHLLNGESYGSLTITTNDPDQLTTNVNLAGVNFADYAGRNEPSIAEMARIFGWTLNTGTESLIYGGAKAPFGDEVYSPYWLRADTTKPVELWALAVTSKPVDTPHGQVSFEAKPGSGGNSGFIYELAGRANDDSPDPQPFPPYTGNAVLGSNARSGGENQKLLPKILIKDANGVYVNSMPTVDTVDFIPTKAFALKNGGSSTDDNKNGTGQLHNWRMFAVRDAKGTLIPHTWFATQDIGNTEGGFKNYDYNDHVYLLKNAKPESPSKDPSIGGLFPGAPGLEFDFNSTYAGSITDKDGQTIGFTSTQLNKNDTFTTKTSYDSSLLDIDPSLGTLKVTTTAGINSSDNTLVNGLQTTFDGRAGKSIISTKLLGSLSEFDVGLRQAGVMLGPDQDNYIKLVARAINGKLGLEFYFENKGIGSSITKDDVSLSSLSDLQSLELMLLTDPRAGTVQAAYRAIHSTGVTDIVPFGSVQLKGGQLGQYFAAQSKTGLIASSKNADPFTVTFDRFAIESNETTAARDPIYRLDVAANSTYPAPDGWMSDTGTGYYTPANAVSETGTNSSAPITNTKNPDIYRTYRAKLGSGTMPIEDRILSYNLPVSAAGKYDLRLHFVEIYFGVSGGGSGGIGRRVFDINIEGQTLLHNFDITAAAGSPMTAVVVPIEGIQVNDGFLNIDFKADVNFGAISGIEVLQKV